MSAINGDLRTISGTDLKPSHEAGAGQTGNKGAGAVVETPEQQSDAVVLDLSGPGPRSIGSRPAVGVPADLSAASALVGDLASQITQAGPQAASAHSRVSAQATFKLTQP